MIGILAFRASPVWILAALADVSGAGRHLLVDITKALKDAELLDADTEFNTIDEILDGLEQTAGHAADTINAPPLDVAGLREEWATLRQNLSKVPPKRLPPIDVVSGLWSSIKSEAKRQKRSVFEMSSVMALSVVATLPEKVHWLSKLAFLSGERTSQMFAAPILDHYSATLDEIRETGFVAYWKRQFRPYLLGAAAQFHPKRGSSTERLLNRDSTETESDDSHERD